MGEFGDILSEFLSGYAGTTPRSTDRTRRQSFKRDASALGMSSEQYKLYLEEERKRKQAQDEANLKATMTSNQNAALEAEAAEAEARQASGGMGPEDTQTRSRYTGAPIGKDIAGLGKIGSDLDFVDTRKAGRAEVRGEEAAAIWHDQLQNEREQENVAQDNFEHEYQLDKDAQELRKKELKVSQRRAKVDEDREARSGGLSEVNLEIMKENLKGLRSGKPKLISSGQALQYAQMILQGQGVLSEYYTPEGAAGAVTSLANQIVRAFENPTEASSLKMRDQVQRIFEEREARIHAEIGGEPGDFEDSVTTYETNFGRSLSKAGQQAGEDDAVPTSSGRMNPDELPEPETPARPPVEDGVPDARALDPSIPIHELLGGREAQAKEQGLEMEANQLEYEAELRELMDRGIRREDWPPHIQAFAEEFMAREDF